MQKHKSLAAGYAIGSQLEMEVTMKKIGDKYTNNTFENIKHIDDYGNEFWFACEL